MRVAGNSLGVDYHEKSLQVCVIASDGRRIGAKKCENSSLEVIEFASRLGEVRGGAVEVSCGAASFVEEIRRLTGWDMKLCHPGYVRRMKNNPDKSDKTDAEVLADLHRVEYLPEVWLPPADIRDLRQLCQFREKQVEEQTRIKIQLRALFRHNRIQLPPKFDLKTIWTRAWVKENISLLAEHSQWCAELYLQKLASLEAELRILLKRFDAIAKNDSLIQWLMSRPGIGIISAVLIRAYIGTATRFRTAKQFSRFCGVTPCNASSGQKQVEYGLIRAGNSALKRVLVQAAHRLRRLDPYWKDFSARLRENGKAGPVIVAAVANRWLRRLFHEMREFELAPK